jgi:hypothetical protein
LSPIPGERGAATARGHRLQPRQPAASEPFAQNWSLTSLQQRLLKTGGQLIRYARYFRLQLAENYLTGPLFRQILALVQRLAWPPTRSRGKPGARRAIASGVSLWGMFVSEMCSGKGGTALLGARRAVSPNQQYRRPDGAVGTRQGGSGKQMVSNRQIPAWNSPLSVFVCRQGRSGPPGDHSAAALEAAAGGSRGSLVGYARSGVFR